MLDQNTDRMWYVIGAVIIGAAIIFIMSGVFPNVFGTIGETFRDKTEDVTTVVEQTGGEMTDGIGPKKENLFDTDDKGRVKLGAAEFARDRAMVVVSEGSGVTKYTVLDQGEESYYRFMPDLSTNRYGLETGEYTLSGYIYIPAETQGSIEVRTQYSIASGSVFSWHNDYGNGGKSFDAIERDKWVYFSQTATVPEIATGYYVSLTSRDSVSRVAGDVFYTKELRYEYNGK